MLSKKFVISLSRVILFGKRMLAMPYDWDDAKERVSMGSSKQKFAINLGTFYLFMEAGYQAWVLYVEFGVVDDMPLLSHVKLISHFVTRLTGITITTLVFTKAHRREYFINQIFYLNQRLQVYENGTRGNDPCGRLLGFSALFVMFQPLVVALNYVGENRDKRYWHGALIPSAIQPFFIPLFFLVEYWISLLALAGTIMTTFVMVSYFSSAPQWTQLLIEKERQINENVGEHDAYIYYRALEILNRVYNDSYSFIWGFGMASAMIDLVMMIVGTIRLSPNTEFPANLLFPVGLLGLLLVTLKVFDPAANVTSASQEFIAQQRKRGRLEEMKRLRSLRPLTLQAWIFFTMHKDTVPAFLNRTLDYSVSVLLMT